MKWRAAVRQHPWVARLMVFFSVLGPGLIAANADNDASGIYGYSIAGAAYQYKMLWVLVLSTVALAVCQEMGARMGAVTGKGLADLLRECYGVRITVGALLCLLVANFATVVSEFAGILAATGIYFGEAARFLVLPLVGLLLWALVARGTYRVVEIVLLCASSLYLLYVASAFLARPEWPLVAHETFLPDLKAITPLQAYVFMVINVVGTTITPWGQFYIQSSVRDKGLAIAEYRDTRIDVLFGAFFTNFIAFFIVVCCGATLYKAGIHNVDDAGQVAKALAPLAGAKATLLFSVGLFNASCFGAIAVPLSTAYAFSEALGAESAVSSRFEEAPLFMGLFTFIIAASVLLVMVFPGHLAALIILPNIVGAVLLPVILILSLKLVNDRQIMGEHANGPIYNFIAWTTAVVLILLSLLLLSTFFIS
jgi:Mn2+/Fe2+ NRAMP family transporter